MDGETGDDEVDELECVNWLKVNETDLQEAGEMNQEFCIMTSWSVSQKHLKLGRNYLAEIHCQEHVVA